MTECVEEKVKSAILGFQIRVRHAACQTYLSTKPILSKHKVPIGLSLPWCDKCGGYVIGDKITQDEQEALKWNLEHIQVPGWYREGREPTAN